MIKKEYFIAGFHMPHVNETGPKQQTGDMP
jgi:hypothetical protein